MPAPHRWTRRRATIRWVTIGLVALPALVDAQTRADAPIAAASVGGLIPVLGALPAPVALRRSVPEFTFVKGAIPAAPELRSRPPYGLIGALVGAGLGGAYVYHECRHNDCMTLMPFVTFGAGGGAVGATIGWIIERLTAPVAATAPPPSRSGTNARSIVVAPTVTAGRDARCSMLGCGDTTPSQCVIGALRASRSAKIRPSRNARVMEPTPRSTFPFTLGQ